MTISLTGFMGCGKSSVGRKLSELLCCSYVDLDVFIESSSGMSIPEIFTSEGEPAFRKMELEALYSLIADPRQTDDDNLVLSLGGGTIMNQECAGLVHDQTLCIYLRASVETLASRLEGEAEGRPMLSSAIADKTGTSPYEALCQRISELMSLRSETYAKTAHIIIDVDGKSIDIIADEILKKIR